MRSIAGFARIVVLFPAVLVASAAAQPTTETPAQLPTFLDRMPVDCTTFFFVNDPLPHIEAILASEQVKRIFAGNTLVATAALPQPQQLLEQVRALQGFVPKEIAAGVPPAAYVQLMRLGRIGLYAGLAVGAGSANEAKTLAALQNRLTAEVRNLKVPRMVVYANFRDEAVPQLIMGLATSLVPPDSDTPTEDASRGGGTMEEVPVEQLRMQQPDPRGGPEEEPPVEDRRATDFRAGDPNYQEPVVEDPRALDPRAGERGYEEPPMEEAPPMDPRAIDARGGEIPREGPPMEGEDGGGSFLPAFAPTDAKLLTIDIAVSDYLPVEAIAPALQQFGGFDEERGKALAEAISELSLQATLTRDGTAIQLVMGPGGDRKVRPLKSKPLHGLWKPGPELLYYAQWDIAALRKGWEDLWAEWLRWEATPAGEGLKKLDTGGVLQDLNRSHMALQKLATRGAMRVTAVGRVVDVTIHEQEFPASPALADAPVTDLFPKTATTMIADSTQTLADVAAAYYVQAEDGLAMHSSPSGGSQETPGADRDTNDARLEKLRKLVCEESREMFIPPLGLITSGGKLESLAVAVGDTPATNITARGITEFAVIGRLRPGSAGGKTFYADVCQAVLDALGKQIEQPLVEERDLGLGVPTKVFLPALTEALPVKVSITARGDLLPHYFVLDGWLVLSSSPRLSQAIVAAAAKEPKEVKLPNLKNKLVALGWMSSKATGQFINDMQTFVELLDPPAPSTANAGQQAFGQALELVRAFALLMNNVKWYVTETEDTRITSYRVVWEK